MDLKAIIRSIKVNVTAPLAELEKFFGRLSLENWLQRGFGKELSECISDESENKDFNQENVEKYAIILCAIIPPMPNFFEDELEKTYRFTKNYSSYCTDMVQVDKLISMIVRPLFEVCHRVKDFSVPFLSKAVVKAVFYASSATLIANEDVFLEQLLSLTGFHLDPCCRKESHTLMALLITLGRKMSTAWLQRILNPQILLRMKFILMRNKWKMCPFVDYLRKLYVDLEFENQIDMRVPTWNLLIDACEMFQCKNAITALRCIADMIDENTMCVQQFIQSGVLYKLQSLLCNPTENGHTTADIKAFLRFFLKFESGDEGTYAWSGHLFKTLVNLVVETLEFFLSLLNTLLSSDHNVHGEYSQCAIDKYDSDIIVLLNLLQSLYTLNSSWHQWFDIMEETKIIDEIFFESNIFNLLLEMELDDETGRLPWFIKMTEICPVVAKLELRLDMFRETLPLEKNTKSIAVKRNNVLRDVVNIFRKYGETMSFFYWNFTFKGELGNGPGVAKEVYSILSQELQKNDYTLWLLKSTQRSDKKVRHCQLPKADKGTAEFIFLGQVMAKVILDGHLLDMPVTNDFFQKLRPTKYPHLKKDYFDLPQTFPLLKSIFAQLLSVKRKVETIRSEISFSEQKKRELISNLTFDDGSSFDDLCLNFTVPGSGVELMEKGREVLLSPHNIDMYFEKLCHHKLELESENEHQFAAIIHGFVQTLHSGNIDLFSPEEIKRMIFHDQFKRLNKKDLHAHIVHDNSQSVQFLFECLASFDDEEQKSFLKFVTSSTCLPFGGLSKLNPPLTISRIKLDNPDSSLPTAAACFHRFYLPDYSNLEVTKEKLLYAILEGGTFQLV